MRRLIALTFFLSLAIVGYVVAESYPPAPDRGKPATHPESYSRQDENNTDRNKQATNNFAQTIEISKPLVVHVDKTEENRDYSSSEWWLVYFTLFLASITAALAFYTGKLYRATVALGEDAKATSTRQAGEMEKSLAIANSAVQAAISGNELNRKTFISSQRPWVVVHKIVPRSSIDLNHGFSLAFIVKNVGHSPAMNVDVSSILHLPHRGDPHEAHQKLRDERARTRPALLSNDVSIGHLIIPGEEMEIQVRFGMNLAECQKAAARCFGEIIILILGQVSYGFGIEGSQHESGFIFSVRRRGGANITLAGGSIPIHGVELERFPAGFYAT